MLLHPLSTPRPALLSRRALVLRTSPTLAGSLIVACRWTAPRPQGPTTGGQPVLLHFMYAGEPTVRDTHTAMADLFTQRYPYITIEQVHVAQQYIDKLLTSLISGSPPDVFWLGGSDMQDFAERGLLHSLTPLLRRDRLDTTDIYPPALTQYQWKGEQYGLPRDWAARLIFYNVDAFNQAGLLRPATTFKDLTWTWERFLLAARSLTRRDGEQVMQYGADVLGGFRVWSAWIYNNGGQIIDAPRAMCRLTDPAAVEALQFLQDTIHVHRVAVPRDVLDREGARNLFMNGRVAMQEGTYGYMVSYKRIQLFEWDITYMPINRRSAPAVGGGGVCFAMSPQGKHSEEAWTFLKHLISFDAQFLMAQMGGGASCLRRVMSHPAITGQRPPEHFTIFTEAGDHVRIDPPVLRWNQMLAVINREMNDLWDGKRPAKDVAAAICQGIEPYLAEQRQ
jgi:multiple sugar transport system substrate-binding protein